MVSKVGAGIPKMAIGCAPLKELAGGCLIFQSGCIYLHFNSLQFTSINHNPTNSDDTSHNRLHESFTRYLLRVQCQHHCKHDHDTRQLRTWQCLCHSSLCCSFVRGNC